MLARSQLSVILPIYNEEAILRRNVIKLKSLLDQLNVSYEILMCDDHSNDGTQQEALNLINKDPTLTYLRFSRRIGKGGTIKNAARIANGEYIMFLDMDVPISYPELKKINAFMERQVELILAIRTDRPVTTLPRKIMSLYYNTIVRLLFTTGICDHQCGLKIFSNSLAQKVFPLIRSDGFLFDTELLVHSMRMNVRKEIIHMSWKENRPEGTSTIVPLRTIFTLLTDLFFLRVSSINGVTLLSLSECEIGEFKNVNLNATYKIKGLYFGTNNQKLLNFLRMMYSKIAFGNSNS